MKDGGPAFPSDLMDFQPGTGEQVVREHYEGMTLRDYFAGQAVMGLCTADAWADLQGHETLVARICGGLADAMIKEREKI